MRQALSIEALLEREYFAKQFQTLIKRYKAEDVILVRVLADYYQHAANEAKGGRISQAKSELNALSDVRKPADTELRFASRISERSVWALVSWKEGAYPVALGRLHKALDACAWLSVRRDHTYLTGRKIHIALNIARVMIAMGDLQRATQMQDALQIVIEGNPSAWPFAHPHTLRLPLEDPELGILKFQFLRNRNHLAKASKITARAVTELPWIANDRC